MPIVDPVARRAYQKDWCRRRRARYLDGRECEWCSSTEELQFHHRDPNKKTSHKVWSWATERLEAELAKCIVLCGGCHRQAHADARRVEAELRNPHGTYLRYKLGCRCDPCRAANRDHQRVLKARAKLDELSRNARKKARS